MQVPLHYKQAAKSHMVRNHGGVPVRAIAAPIDRDSTPSRGLLARLANWMAEGKYSLFLHAFSPRVRAEIIRGAREIEDRQPVLPKWEPTKRHLAVSQDLPKDATP